MDNISPEVLKLIKNISSWKIRSSSEVAEKAFTTLASIIMNVENVEELIFCIAWSLKEILNARPTAAILINNSRELLLELKKTLNKELKTSLIKKRMLDKLKKLTNKINSDIERIATIGANRIIDGDIIMTSAYSRTVMRIFEKALRQGKKFKVYVTESRPGDDGKIIASKLSRLGVSVILIVDSAMRYFMKDVSKVIVGAEAVAANGAVISKVGASLMALIAHEARVRVFIVASTSKFNFETIFGELVKIPQAPEETILDKNTREKIGENLKVEVPVLDVIPPEYIDAIITEYGVIAPQAIPILIKKIYESWPLQVLDENILIEDILKKVENYELSQRSN